MPVNRATLTLVKKFEGFAAEAYPDAGYGWDRPTIGYGHTSQAGPPDVRKGMTITRPVAELYLIDDLDRVAEGIAKHVTVPLNENQHGALCSFVFNVGLPAFQHSTLLRKLNAGDYKGAADEFPRWNKSNGKVLPSLTRRRADEAVLFLTASADIAPPPKPLDQIAIPEPVPVPTVASGFMALLMLFLAFLKKVFRK